MPTYSANHAFQESDKYYSNGELAPAGYWSGLRASRRGGVVQQVHLLSRALYRRTSRLQALVKQVIQSGEQLNYTVVLTEVPNSINWKELTDYFRMRLEQGAL